MDGIPAPESDNPHIPMPESGDSGTNDSTTQDPNGGPAPREALERLKANGIGSEAELPPEIRPAGEEEPPLQPIRVSQIDLSSIENLAKGSVPTGVSQRLARILKNDLGITPAEYRDKLARGDVRGALEPLVEAYNQGRFVAEEPGQAVTPPVEEPTPAGGTPAAVETETETPAAAEPTPEPIPAEQTPPPKAAEEPAPQQPTEAEAPAATRAGDFLGSAERRGLERLKYTPEAIDELSLAQAREILRKKTPAAGEIGKPSSETLTSEEGKPPRRAKDKKEAPPPEAEKAPGEKTFEQRVQNRLNSLKPSDEIRTLSGKTYTFEERTTLTALKPGGKREEGFIFRGPRGERLVCSSREAKNLIRPSVKIDEQYKNLTTLKVGRDTLKLEKREPEKVGNVWMERFYFVDQRGQKRNFLGDIVRRTLGQNLNDQIRAERAAAKRTETATKPADEEEKGPKSRLRERLESAGALVKKGAETNAVTEALYNYVNRFADKFRWKDKEKSWYVAGIVTGAGTNVALSAFVPFLSFGPGRFVRSATYSGVLLGVSYGINRFRNHAVGKVLEGFGVKDAAEKNLYVKRFDEVFRELRKAHGTETYQAKMLNLSNELFAKYGMAASSVNAERDIGRISAEAMLRRIESLNTKYQKLNSNLRSFSAGLTVGTLSSTGVLGHKEIISGIQHTGSWVTSLGSGLKDKLGFGGDHEIATPTGIPGSTTPPHGIEAIATPTPTPIPGHEILGAPETPGVPGAPPPEAAVPNLPDVLSNPDLTHNIAIHQGDTVGQLLVNNGHEVTWGTGDADLFGTHALANYDLLREMHDNVAGVGIATEHFPTQDELVNLINLADGGDAAAMHELTETLHWIPANGEFKVLSDTGIEAIKKRYNLG